MDLNESFLKKITYSQRLIITALAKKSDGMLSKELAHKSGVSNKSSVIGSKFKESLAKEGFEIFLEKVSREWLWKLRRLPSTDEGKAS